MMLTVHMHFISYKFIIGQSSKNCLPNTTKGNIGTLDLEYNFKDVMETHTGLSGDLQLCARTNYYQTKGNQTQSFRIKHT